VRLATSLLILVEEIDAGKREHGTGDLLDKLGASLSA
jgi:hypothetical protein